MSATALIVFREVLEAALVVGIVMAATRGIRGRNLWISFGIGGGVIGAILIAVFARAVASAAEGMGQEVLNAAVLLVAVAMLGWHNIWMSRAGKAMGQEMAAIGRSVRASEQPISVLAVVIGVAVLREGSEIVLFLYGVAASSGNNSASMLAGGAIGLGLGAVAGSLIYFGVVRFAGKYLFLVTGWMILLLAAGMAAQAAKFLSQAGYLDPLGYGIWDTSAILSDSSAIGTLLHVLIGYTARPDGIQLLFYGLTILLIGGLMLLLRKPPAPSAAT